MGAAIPARTMLPSSYEAVPDRSLLLGDKQSRSEALLLLPRAVEPPPTPPSAHTIAPGDTASTAPRSESLSHITNTPSTARRNFSIVLSSNMSELYSRLGLLEHSASTGDLLARELIVRSPGSICFEVEREDIAGQCDTPTLCHFNFLINSAGYGMIHCL